MVIFQVILLYTNVIKPKDEELYFVSSKLFLTFKSFETEEKQTHIS